MSDIVADGVEHAARNPFTTISDQLKRDRSRMRSREVAYEAVKGAILGGLLEPHERLVEERIAEALELSRTPVREALAILEHEGLIEWVPRKGLMVKPVTVGEFLNMYEALGVIEAAIARAAVMHLTSHDVIVLLAILDEAEACIPDDIIGHLTKCREFQQRLGECAGSPVLTRLLLSIEERSDIHLIQSNQKLSPGNMHAAVTDRRAILNAVRDEDPAAAAAAAEAHAESIRTRWRDMYPAEPT